MKTKNINRLLALMACCTLAFTSCTKESSDQTDDLSVEAQTIAVAPPQTTGINGNTGSSDDDTVYVLHECKEREQKTTVTEANLSADIKTYLTTNYNGYTFVKAIKIAEQGNDNAIKGYIVIIYFNDKPVALRFNADGSFKKVLEQREKKDVKGKGWHLGGRFQNRSGLMQDTVAFADIPVGIMTFFRATYGTDTLTRAYKVHKGGYLLLSVNNGVYATAFHATGAFFKRIKLNAREGKATAIEATALPAAITTYLTTTYPGYVFNRAYTISANGAIKGYVVVIDANNTHYGLAFDSNGNFEAAKVIK